MSTPIVLSLYTQWAEASALFSHTRGLCQEAADLLGDGPRVDSLKNLDEMVKGAWHRTVAHALLLKAKQEAGLAAGVERVTIGDGGSRGNWVSVGRPLQERLGEFDSTVGGGDAESRKTRAYRIADFPPSLQLLPCKPRLLDLAFEELEFPDLDERAGIEKKSLEDEEAKAAAVASRSTGISGWVGWALGR